MPIMAEIEARCHNQNNNQDNSSSIRAVVSSEESISRMLCGEQPPNGQLDRSHDRGSSSAYNDDSDARPLGDDDDEVPNKEISTAEPRRDSSDHVLANGNNDPYIHHHLYHPESLPESTMSRRNSSLGASLMSDYESSILILQQQQQQHRNLSYASTGYAHGEYPPSSSQQPQYHAPASLFHPNQQPAYPSLLSYNSNNGAVSSHRRESASTGNRNINPAVLYHRPMVGSGAAAAFEALRYDHYHPQPQPQQPQLPTGHNKQKRRMSSLSLGSASGGGGRSMVMMPMPHRPSVNPEEYVFV
jgi:hypothetical protein